MALPPALLKLGIEQSIYDKFYNDPRDSDELAEIALDIIYAAQRKLDRRIKNYSLRNLLTAMLQHAPSPPAKRHVACVLLAYPEPVQVADVADLWFTELFVPFIESGLHYCEIWPFGQTDEEEEAIEEMCCKVLQRQPVCPLTLIPEHVVQDDDDQGFDESDSDSDSDFEGPRYRGRTMEAVPIIPEFLLRLKDKWDTTRSLLHSWTGVEFDKLLDDPSAFVGVFQGVKDLFIKFCVSFNKKDDGLYFIQPHDDRSEYLGLPIPRDHRFKEGSAPRADLLAIHAAIGHVLWNCRSPPLRRKKTPSNGP